MPYQLNEKLYEHIQSTCLEGFQRKTPLMALVDRIWENADFPMHCPEHHYLVPAVLLTVYRRLKNDDILLLKQDLITAAERSRNVLAGFCGWYGACGAAIGSGIFLSVLTDTSPYSSDTWGLVNRITAQCLSRIASLGGPRCCKRVCYTALVTSVAFMKDNMELVLDEIPDIRCIYHERNAECISTLCPYYGEKEGEI